MNTFLAPGAVILTIIGIMLCAVVPPIGVLVLFCAIPAQRSFRRSVRDDRQKRYDKARERQRRDMIIAARSLS